MKKKSANSKLEEIQLLTELEDVLNKFGIELRYEKGSFKGGLCRIENSQYFYLSKILSVEQKIQIISDQLQQLDLESVYLKPKLREILAIRS